MPESDRLKRERHVLRHLRGERLLAAMAAVGSGVPEGLFSSLSVGRVLTSEPKSPLRREAVVVGCPAPGAPGRAQGREIRHRPPPRQPQGGTP
jgi:hypothetical protein